MKVPQTELDSRAQLPTLSLKPNIVLLQKKKKCAMSGLIMPQLSLSFKTDPLWVSDCIHVHVLNVSACASDNLKIIL